MSRIISPEAGEVCVPFKPRIWSGEIRRVLYGRLVAKFGPYEQWEKVHTPGRGMDQAFDDFCVAFASIVGAESGEAVRIQIRFAMPESTRGSSWGRQTQTAILNKAAALEMGFIEDRHLPNLHATGRERID